MSHSDELSAMSGFITTLSLAEANHGHFRQSPARTKRRHSRELCLLPLRLFSLLSGRSGPCLHRPSSPFTYGKLRPTQRSRQLKATHRASSILPSTSPFLSDLLRIIYNLFKSSRKSSVPTWLKSTPASNGSLPSLTSSSR